MYIEVTARELLLMRAGAHTKFMEHKYKNRNGKMADEYAKAYQKLTVYWNNLSANDQAEALEEWKKGNTKEED